MKKVIIIDTSILCVWLKIPNMEVCGPDIDRWDFSRVDSKLQDEIKNKTTLVLPQATLIETGNHIAQANGNKYIIAKSLSDIIIKTAEERTPWAAFSFQNDLWSVDKLKNLAINWPELAAQGISIGDATIKDVAEYYAKAGLEVEIMTGDVGLKAHEPYTKLRQPRRRR